ncbi:biotin/lipoyl-containing protein [Acuticoccus kandeliae]|uniref:biotin/lipoyl-containing protein n=1 Tax=Acuticoccus kandeliae TaxID=2073160 RepID=UPI000D3E2AB5|nr:biotin/lipoyl-containing protein [Acuticoccus kandeliae]
MAHDVLMPQLGMVQDAGLIVAWHKKPGDTVAADDVLMEVETDKATMEVPAGRDGILAEIRAEAGTEVPVGDIIAVIAADAAEAKALPSAAAPAAPAASPAAPAEPARSASPAEPARSAPTATPAKPPAPPSAPTANGRTNGAAPAEAAPPASGGRVFATPKARRLAAERGIDLAALLKAGAREPILAAAVAAAPEPALTPIQAARPAAAPTSSLSTLVATAPRAAFEVLLAEADPAPPRAAALAAFAAGAWRAAHEDAPRVTIACRALSAPPIVLTDPDRRPLSRLAADEAPAAPDIALFDLTGSRLSGYRPAGAETLFTVTREGETYSITLSFDEETLPLERAATLLDDFARRIEDPIRQLL